MPKYMATAATSINRERYKKYKDYCKSKACTPNTDLKNYILSIIEPKPTEVSESKNDESRGKIEINNGSNNESISESDGELQTANPTGTEEFFFI